MSDTELAKARRNLRNLQARLRRVKARQGTRSQAASVLRDQIAYAKASVADELLALEWAEADELEASDVPFRLQAHRQTPARVSKPGWEK